MKIKDEEIKVRLEELQGDAYSKALDYMKKEDNYVEEEIEDYIVTVVSEKAEGTYQFENGKLNWHTPDKNKNTHMEVVVRDKNDKRFIPDLQIRCKIFNEEDRLIDEEAFSFFWHPFLNHYGCNFHIPKEGEYFVEITIPAPQFPRHDEIKGKRYKKDVKIKLGPLKLEAGRKPHGPE